MIKPIGVAMLAVLLVSVSRPERAFGVHCDPTGADAAALDTVWHDMDAQCPCAGATSRGTYVKCAGTVVKAAMIGGTVSTACKKSAKQRATLSTCGRPGSVVCCRTMSNGTVKGKITASARCMAPSHGQACIAGATNVVDGCSAAGCVACGNGVVERGEACEPPGVGFCTSECQVAASCGNGIIEPGETCEPPGATGCTDSCVAGTCTAPPAGEIAVACISSNDDLSVSVGAGGDGYLVAWPGSGAPGANVIRARRLDAGGVPADAALTLTVPTDGIFVGSPLVAGDAGGWDVSYYASHYPQWSIAGLHVTPDGTPEQRHGLASGESFGQCQSGTFGPSALVAEGSDRFVVALTNYIGCFPNSFVLYGHSAARMSFANGTPTGTGLGSPDPIVFTPGTPPPTASAQSVAVAHGGDDTVMVLIQSGADFFDVNAHWLPVPGGTTRLKSAATVRPQGVAAGVAAGGSDAQFVAAWAAPNTGFPSEIRILRFTHADGPLDADGGIVVASGVAPQAMPAVVSDGATWLVVWLDGPSAGPWKVLGVGVRPDGSVVDATPRVLATSVEKVPPSLTSRGSGWLLGVVRTAGAGLGSVTVVPIAP